MFKTTNNQSVKPFLRPSGNAIRFFVGLLLIVVGLGLNSNSAIAQGNGHNNEQLQVYLERNEELLDWAGDLVNDTDSAPARRVLDQAQQLHRRSQNMMNSGQSIQSFGAARRVRAAIWHSVELARESMSYGERIRLRRERFRDQHAQLTERARESDNTQALDFLNRARNQAGRASEQYNQGNTRLSFKVYEQAEKLMSRASRLLADSGGPERLNNEIERTGQLIEQAREQLGSNSKPEFRRIVGEAEEALDKAVRAREQGSPGRALQMAGLARRLISRASVSGNTELDKSVIERQIERWQIRSEVVAEVISNSGQSAARQMYQRAVDHQQRAERSLQAGELENALRQIRAAHDLLNQSEDLARH